MKGFKINANYRKFISYLKKQTKVDWIKKDYTLIVDDDEEEKDEIKKKVKDE